MLRKSALECRSGLAVSEKPGIAVIKTNADKPAIKRFTSGPATAIRMSRFQPSIASGRACASSRMVTPPIGNRMMAFAGMPEPWATRACPNSWSTTLPKTMPTRASPRRAALAFCTAASVPHTKTSRNTNVR